MISLCVVYTVLPRLGILLWVIMSVPVAFKAILVAFVEVVVVSIWPLCGFNAP